jgi:hypothetical protein
LEELRRGSEKKVIAALEPAPYNDATVVLQLKVINDSLEGQTRQRMCLGVVTL